MATVATRRLGGALLAAALGLGSLGGATAQQGDSLAAGAATYAENCARCHMIGAGARHRIGPHLNEIVERAAGQQAGYAFSAAMVAAGVEGLMWTSEELDAFIANPRSVVTSTKMLFPGLEDADQRAALIAFIESYSASPRDIPEAPPTLNFDAFELPPELDAAKGDPAYGEYLSGECVACHQLDGEMSGGIPSITGWPVEDFKAALHAYRAKLRPHPVMQMISATLSDAEIAALAVFFADQGQ